MPKFSSLSLSIAFCYCLVSPIATAQNHQFWQDITEKNILSTENRHIFPEKYRLVSFDFDNFNRAFASIPKGGSEEVKSSSFVLTLPLPDGTWQNFRLMETPLLTPDFAEILPNVRTFTGQGIEDKSATAYLDWTSRGFHAMVISLNGTFFIDPYQRGNVSQYQVYRKQDFKGKNKQLSTLGCGFSAGDKSLTGHKKGKIEGFKIKSGEQPRPSGTQKRTYRLAVAATGEYTQYHNDNNPSNGNAVIDAQNAIITTFNRVRGIYEKEVAISFTLINNTAIIYDDGSTDPFNNTSAGQLIDQSQAEIDAKIGSANYDIGHTVSTGGGGLAGLGVVCLAGQKARGITGSSQPEGDSYDVDFVAHEVGHQFDGNHTFNGNQSNCAGGNRNASTAYEPGSGTTIQAYAGICGGDNTQSNSDAYFHTISYDEIVGYTVDNAGNNCPTTTSTGNSVPVITIGTGGFTIPASTPFTLTGSATDANAGDVLSYCWEQFDLGPAGSPNFPTGNAPLFRSFSPVSSPSRTFPRIQDITSNVQTLGEILPNYTRSLTFRLTVRDNQPIGGVDYATISFNVTAEAGPFLVTQPNTALSWQAGSTQSITWDRAKTNLAPVNCQKVNILLSTDGGLTYPIVLAQDVANDGSEYIIVPNNPTTQARVKVEAKDNIFFDISNTNFTITAPSAPTFTLLVQPDKQTVAAEADAVYQVRVGQVLGFSNAVTLSVVNLPAGLSAAFGTNPISPTNTTNLTIGNTEAVNAGSYNFTVKGMSGAIEKNLLITLTIGDNGVNDFPPTAADEKVTALEDVNYTFTIADFSNSYADDDNEALQSIRISAIDLPTGASLRHQGVEIGATELVIPVANINTGNLVFRGAANAFGAGYANFKFEVFDGGFYSTTKYTMTIDVTPINDFPQILVNKGLKTFPQTTRYTIESGILSAEDIEDEAEVLKYRITTKPNKGNLKLNEVVLNNNQTFTQADINQNRVTYHPTDTQGEVTDSFVFQVEDTGGALNSAQNFVISIKGANVFADNVLKIAPNPSTAVFNVSVDFPSTLILKMRVTDMTGKTVKEFTGQKESGKFDLNLDMTQQLQGLYLLEVETTQGRIVRKLIKQQ